MLRPEISRRRLRCRRARRRRWRGRSGKVKRKTNRRLVARDRDDFESLTLEGMICEGPKWKVRPGERRT